MIPASFFHFWTLRRLCACSAFCALIASVAPARAQGDVAFVSAVKGKPQLQVDSRRSTPLGLMQVLASGATIALRATDSVDVCHESAAKTFHVEGAGVVRIEPTGLGAEGPRVTELGGCDSSAAPGETGGVLLRSLRERRMAPVR